MTLLIVVREGFLSLKHFLCFVISTAVKTGSAEAASLSQQSQSSPKHLNVLTSCGMKLPARDRITSETRVCHQENIIGHTAIKSLAILPK